MSATEPGVGSPAPAPPAAGDDVAVPAPRPGFLELPEGFVLGAATSSYQIEGAASEGGRKPSIWDGFTRIEGKIADGSTGDVACDHYHRFRDDVAIMGRLGLQAYRLSVSWSRLLPDGDDRVNPEGAKFYSDLLDALLAEGITPWVTLYHWDLPTALQDAFGGWLGPKERIVGAFAVYARTCFKLFGDRVKHWITLNEPWTYIIMGYQFGLHPPGRARSQHEQYAAGHNSILAHAEAARIYREEFKPVQGGQIGAALCMNWMHPGREDSEQDVAAAQRRLSFMLGWFADPLFHGDYPACMRETCGDRLPRFTEEESANLRGSCDFFGLNYYGSALCSDCSHLREMLRENVGGFASDVSIHLFEDNGWERTANGWVVVPWGLRRMLLYIQERYAPAGGIFITECGCVCDPQATLEQDAQAEPARPVPHGASSEPEDFDGETLDDPQRVRFYRAHLSAVIAAREQGADVRGFFAWSLLDNFEWNQGYKQRFGIVRVDYATQKRTIKASGRFLAETVRRRGFDAPPRSEQYGGRVF